MSKITSDKKFELCSMAGKIGGARNVESGHIKQLGLLYGEMNGRRCIESGHLDRIRPLANNEEQRRKLRLTHQMLRENGGFERLVAAGNAAWRGSKHTDEYKKNKSEDYKNRFATNPEYRNRIMEAVKLSSELKTKKSKEFSEKLIENAERNEEFLHKTSSKSLNYFISPEGLKFESPVFAAKYYGNGVKPYVIENWCKREQNGWKREPKDSA